MQERNHKWAIFTLFLSHFFMNEINEEPKKSYTDISPTLTKRSCWYGNGVSTAEWAMEPSQSQSSSGYSSLCTQVLNAHLYNWGNRIWYVEFLPLK